MRENYFVIGPGAAPFLVGVSSSIIPSACPDPQAPYVQVSKSLENLETELEVSRPCSTGKDSRWEQPWCRPRGGFCCREASRRQESAKEGRQWQWGQGLGWPLGTDSAPVFPRPPPLAGRYWRLSRTVCTFACWVWVSGCST